MKFYDSRFGKFAVVGIVAALSLAIFCGVWKSFELASKQRAENDRVAARQKGMRWAVLSLANYEGEYGVLPAAVTKGDTGIQLSSWRLAVIPFSPVEKQVDVSLPWNKGINLQVTKRAVFFCFRNKKSVETSVFAVAGLGTAFDPNRRMGWDDLPDDTILLVEVANSGVRWGAPGDLEIAEVDVVLPALLDGKGFHVAFADLSVWHLDASIPLKTLRHFFLIDSARTHDREQLLGPYRIVRRQPYYD